MPLDNQSATGSASKLGKYELLRETSSSGVAATWLARAEGPRTYSILRLNKNVTKKVEVAETFLKEAKNAKLLAHANVVPMVETSVGDGEVFVVSEHVEGEPLSALVAQAKTEGIPLPIALRIGIDMLEGLAAAHALTPEPIVHAELSPLHVLVGADGVTRVAGLGWARALARLGPHGVIKQDRLAYATPERVKALSASTPGAPPPPADVKTDVFAAGVILWELFSRQRLFASKMEAAVVQKVLSGPIASLSGMPGVKVPAAVEEAVKKALERDPAKRLESIEELAKVLKSAEKIATHQEVAALVEKLASKAAAAPTSSPAASTRAALPTVMGIGAATPAPPKAAPAPPAEEKAANGKAPVAAKPAAKDEAAPSVKAPALSAAATPAPPKAGPGVPMTRQKTMIGGLGPVEIPKPAGAAGSVTVPKPAAKAEPPKAEAKPAEKAEPPKAEAKPAEKPADKADAAPTSEPAKKPLPKPALPKPATPAPPKVAVAAIPKPPPPRPPAESLPAEDVEVDLDGPSKVEIKPELPKAEAKPVEKAEAKPAEKDEAKPAEKAEPKPEPEKAAAEAPKVEAPKDEHVPVTKSEMPTAITTTPTSDPLAQGGDAAPMSKGRAAALDKLKPGSTLGRYEVLLRVAKGGMASVWAARLQGSRGFQKIVAVKTMLPDVSDDPDFETMFLDEARVAARIRHPNVVEIFDLGEEEDILYIVMEWVEGDTLSTIQKASKALGGIPQNIIVRLASQICAGLHAAHELRDDNGALVDLVHRDISPGNILVSTSGFAKIADFGVAKSRGRLYVTRAEGVVKGKTPYLSPEQLGGLPLDRRSDLFSLGVLLYVMVTGLHPFRGETEFKTVENIALKDPIPPRELVPSTHPDLEKVLLKALEKDRNKRFATAGEMQRALDAVGAALGQPITDEDVADFVRQVIGEQNAKRAAELRGAIAAADANAAVNSERPSMPPAAPTEARQSKPDAAEAAQVAAPVEAKDAAAANPFEVPAPPPAKEEAPAIRLETLPSMPTVKPSSDDLNAELAGAKAAAQKKRKMLGAVAAAVVVIGGAVVAMSLGGGKDKATTEAGSAPEKASAAQVAAPEPAKTAGPTETAKVVEPAPTPTPAEPVAPAPAATEEPAATAAAPEPPTPPTPQAGGAKGALTTKSATAGTTGTSKTTTKSGGQTKTTTKTTKTTKKYDPTGI